MEKQNKYNWLRLDSSFNGGEYDGTHIMKIPGGWILRNRIIRHEDNEHLNESFSLVHIPDPEHKMNW